MAGGVPEVMLHLRRMGLLNGRVLTATGDTLDATLDWWESSERRRAARARLASARAVDPISVIMSPDAARRAGLTSTVVFPRGNLAPQGSVIKATAIDSSVIDADGVYRHRGPARVFTDEREAIQAVKGTSTRPVREGDVIVLIGMGPSGTGMQETAQITTALRYLPWGKHVALITDGRFSGFSTGACIGHVGPEALDDGPIGRVRDDDLIEIVIDRNTLTGTVNLVGAEGVPLDEDVRRAAPRPATRIRARATRATARRQPPLGGAAARERRHMGWVRLRRRSDRGGTRRRGRGMWAAAVGTPQRQRSDSEPGGGIRCCSNRWPCSPSTPTCRPCFVETPGTYSRSRYSNQSKSAGIAVPARS